MPKKASTTIRHRILFKELVNAIETGKVLDWRTLLRKANYSEWTNPHEVIESGGFKKLLVQIDDQVILARFYEILLDKNDKRASLEAGDKLLKLKDRYPIGKLKIDIFQEELSKLK